MNPYLLALGLRHPAWTNRRRKRMGIIAACAWMALGLALGYFACPVFGRLGI